MNGVGCMSKFYGLTVHNPGMVDAKPHSGLKRIPGLFILPLEPDWPYGESKAETSGNRLWVDRGEP